MAKEHKPLVDLIGQQMTEIRVVFEGQLRAQNHKQHHPHAPNVDRWAAVAIVPNHLGCDESGHSAIGIHLFVWLQFFGKAEVSQFDIQTVV